MIKINQIFIRRGLVVVAYNVAVFVKVILVVEEVVVVKVVIVFSVVVVVKVVIVLVVDKLVSSELKLLRVPFKWESIFVKFEKKLCYVILDGLRRCVR